MNRDDVLVLANSPHADIARMFITDVNVREISYRLKEQFMKQLRPIFHGLFRNATL